MNPSESSPFQTTETWWRGIILALDRNGAITHLNEKGSAILACSFATVKGKLWIDTFIQENDRDQVRSLFNNLISGNLAPYSTVEGKVITCTGTVRSIRWYNTLLKDADGKITGTMSYGEDITEEKQAQDSLRKMQQFEESVIANANIWIAVLSSDSTILVWNEAAEAISGFKKSDVIGKKTVWKQLYPDKDYRRKVTGEIQRIIGRDRYLENFETEIRCADGTKKTIVWNTRGMRDNEGTITGFIAIGRDITERKRAEEALQKSEEKFRGIFDQINDGIHIHEIGPDGKPGKFIEVNEVACRMLQYSREELLEHGPLDFVTGYHSRPSEEIFGELVSIGHAIFETEHRRKDGTIIPVEINTHVVSLQEKPVVVAVVRDITGRKQMEEQIRDSRQLFADIISFLPDPTFVIDREGKVLAWNRAIEQLSGVTAGDMIGKGDYEYSLWEYGKRRPILIDLVLHPDQDAGRLDYTDIHVDGHTVTAQADIIPKGSGHTISLLLVASPLVDAQGKITGAIESIRDISRLKETEAELARINQNLEEIVRDRTRALEDEVVQRIQAENDVKDALKYTRSVIEADPDLVTVLDGKGTVMDVNAATESVTGVSREQMIGTSFFSYLVDEGTLHDVFSRLLEKGRIENHVKVHRTDGHITPLSVNATVIAGSAGTDTRIIVAGHDITRQKHDEESIKASLDEKILLLREVHHRVKNNLQIIISLVSLQMRQTNDPAVKQILSETQNRVRAMSLVHEKLYRSGSLSHIDFADYTRFLASQLFSFYGTDTRKVRLDFAMDKIPLDINTAVPLGLLMNELISNSLRHAFPGGREGVISISGVYKGDLITLVVRDNGIGIPEELDWKSTTSLGMQLVTSLVDQVDGTITLDRENGTMFTITVNWASHQEEPDDGNIQANRGLPESPAGKSP